MLHPVFKERWEANKAAEPPKSVHSCICTTWNTEECACKGNCSCHWSWCGQQKDCYTCFHSEEHEYSSTRRARLCHKWDKDVFNIGHCEDWLRKTEPMRKTNIGVKFP